MFSIFAGEHIRNWRPRYFILKDNGQFIGFKKEPTIDVDMTDPLNNFTVKNCQILPSDRPKPFTFIVRGLQMTTVVERMFCVNNEEERKVQPGANTIKLFFLSTPPFSPCEGRQPSS